MTEQHTQPRPPRSEPGAPFFDGIRRLGIVRTADRRIAGVAGGLADRWNLAPVLVRGLFVVAAFFGIGLLVYGVGWALLPEPDGRIHAQQVLKGVWTAGTTGALVLLLIGLPGRFLGPFGWGDGGWWGDWWSGLVWLAAAAAVVWIVVRATQSAQRRPPAGTTRPAASPQPSAVTQPLTATASGAVPPVGADAPTLGAPVGPPPGGPVPPPVPTPPPAPPRPVRRGPGAALVMGTLGVLLIALAAVAAGAWTGALTHGWAVAVGAGAIVVGAGILLAGLLGRREGFLGFLGVVAAIGLIGAALAPSVGPLRNAGDVTFAPSTVTEAEAGSELSAGDHTIDLTDLSGASGGSAASPVEVPVRTGAGRTIVILPADVEAQVHAKVGVGDVEARDGLQAVDGSNAPRTSGLGVEESIRTSAADPALIVTVNAGVGQIVVERSGR